MTQTHASTTDKMEFNVDLQSMHTFALPAQALAVAYFMCDDDFSVDRLRKLVQTYPRYWILGGGSNTLFCQDFTGCIFKIDNRGLDDLGKRGACQRIRVAAGESWHDFVMYTLSQGWYGLENLALIPGTVGAAPIQNIGAYGVEIESVVAQVECIDLHNPSLPFLSLNREICCFAYRDSLFKRNVGRFLIHHVVFDLPLTPYLRTDYGDLARYLPEKPSPLDVAQAVMHIRRNKLPDPTVLPNAGSFFKNPIVTPELYKNLVNHDQDIQAYPQEDGNYKIAAGWLIDRLGMKGFVCGGVLIHRKQALVLINDHHASGQDVRNMVAEIQKRVQQAYGIYLEVEPNLL